jgi:hypothetical protein
MKLDYAKRLLDRIGVLQHPCDLDLLVFFARHPRTLLASEQLAVLLGYEFKQLAASLDLLVGAECVMRTSNQTGAAHMYLFDAGAPRHEWLPDLLQATSTREGRLALLGVLKRAESVSVATPDPVRGNADRGSGPRTEGGL